MAADELLTIRRQSQALIDAGRFSEAAELLAQALSIAPHDADLLCRMSQVLMALKQNPQAVSYAEKALAVYPENAWAHRLRSLGLRQSDRHESLNAAKQAVQIEPNDPWCWFVLTGAHLQVFNLKEAQAAAERLREIAPEWHVSHQVLALVALKREKYKEAEAHCRRELELNPNSYEGMNNLGVALLNQKRKREAIEAFNRAAKINPEAAVARNNINVAVTRYLPKITVPIFAIWMVINGLRVLGEKGESGVVLTVGAFLAVSIGVVLALRWFRFRRLPSEVRGYIKATNRAGQAGARRRWLSISSAVTGTLLLISIMIVLLLWSGGQVAWQSVGLVVAVLIAITFVISIVMLARTPRDV
jgi:tetratricopeptide (TPR) repeat protein